MCTPTIMRFNYKLLLNQVKNLTFFCKSFGGLQKSYTFASAFEKQPDKPNEQNEACFGYVMARVGI